MPLSTALPALDTDAHRRLLRHRLELHLHGIEAERMAQRDQFGAALGRLDAGDARNREHVALVVSALDDQSQRIGTHPDPRLGHRSARARRLGANIDHARLAGIADMG
jgi:hypothetical protein